MTYEIIEGDVLEVLRGMPDASFDALLCDPPYGLSFMSKKWDYDVPSVDVWRECLRVLKPGAPLLAFGGSRTFHRIAIGIEDAGFELRDTLCWLYAKGFPKSLNVGKAIDSAAGAVRPVIGTQTLTGNSAVSLKDKGGTFGVQVGSVPAKVIDVTGPATDLAKQWDGYGTALKPGWEPIILARKPIEGTVAENVESYGCGALNIDGCRLAAEERPNIRSGTGSARTSMDGWGSVGTGSVADGTTSEGRWPANVCLDEGAGAILDEGAGPRKSGVAVRVNGGGGQIFTGIGDNAYVAKPSLPNLGYMDGRTNPSRFFFSAKVSTSEREFGCEALPLRSAGAVTDRDDDTAGLDSPRSGAGRVGGARNIHPTLKPISLARWLATLILPPPRRDGTYRRLLCPYSGAGSEVTGSLRAGWDHVVGIEQDPAYLEIARARIARWLQAPSSMSEAEVIAESEAPDLRQVPMFAAKV